MKPSSLFNILAVPGTNDPLRLVVTRLAGGEPYDGWLEDAEGNIVGGLNAFRFSFVNYSPPTEEQRKRALADGPEQAAIQTHHFVDALSPRINWSGQAIEIGGYLKGFHGDDLAAFFEFETKAPRVELGLHAHGWSGVAAIEVDGKSLTQVDLYNQETALLRRVTIENPGNERIVVRGRPTEFSHPASQGRQLLLEGIFEFADQLAMPIYSKHPPTNRGGEFRPEFFEILMGLDRNAIILDVGGGKRQLDDPRYINFEYSPYEEPDIYGDGMALPFQSNSIDFVYTAAVLEHVRDPLKMGAEIYRVLKPGGQVLAAAAFMQPVHSEGQHFFNVTPYGMELIFASFQNRRVWWEPGFSYTMDWLVDLAGIRGVVEKDKLDTFLALAREFEPHIAYDRAMYLASCVWLRGTK